jgi:hypothetical protein
MRPKKRVAFPPGHIATRVSSRSWAAAVLDRRIEIVIGGKKAPAVMSDPTLSSAAAGWNGFLLERLVKTTRIRRINDFVETSTCWNPVRFLAMIVWLRHLLG